MKLWSIILHFIIVITYQKKSTKDYSQLIKMYKTNDDILNEINSMLNSKSCNIKKTNIDSNELIHEQRYSLYKEKYTKHLFYVDVSSNNENEIENKSKIFIVSGEHARELITVDMTLSLVKSICENRELLAKASYRIILNANPISRDKVLTENNFCLRGNPFNVDINRNWNYFFSKEIELKEEYCGEKAFSEIETKFIISSLDSFKPDFFMTIHSGDFSLFYPFAYHTPTDVNYNELFNKYNSILQPIKDQYCKNCKIGQPNMLIGYISSGSNIDYIFTQKKIPSFAFEIYTQDVKNSFQKNKKLRRGINFNALKEGDSNNCYETFNPENKTVYNNIISNWKSLIIDLSHSLIKETSVLKKAIK